MNQPKLATLLVTLNYLQKKLLSFDTSKFYLPSHSEQKHVGI